MPAKKKLARKIPRPVPLTEGQLQVLRTGEEIDFLVWDLSVGDNAREMFESVRGDYPPGAFPWAEDKFSKRAEG
jgi:hypothetical protein